jgi:hypothetical protein
VTWLCKVVTPKAVASRGELYKTPRTQRLWLCLMKVITSYSPVFDPDGFFSSPVGHSDNIEVGTFSWKGYTLEALFC